jgi:hypothetical protein
MMWNAKYEVVRSARDRQLHMIFVEGRFSAIPEHDRRLGPWQPLGTGHIENLKPQYRVQIGATGYIMVRQVASAFSAEPRPTTRSTRSTSQRMQRTGRSDGPRSKGAR